MQTTKPPGYLGRPDSGDGDSVLVLHAWWGLNDTVKTICDRLAQSGFLAFAPDLSVTHPHQIHSAVLFYGTRPGDDSASRAAYLGHFADSDDFEPQSEVNALEESLRRAGRPVTFHRYPDTGHRFVEPDRPHAFQPQAAQLAWERTPTCLRRPPRPVP